MQKQKETQIEPCGTPQISSAGSDIASSTLCNYDLNQLMLGWENHNNVILLIKFGDQSCRKLFN